MLKLIKMTVAGVACFSLVAFTMYAMMTATGMPVVGIAAAMGMTLKIMRTPYLFDDSLS